MSDENVEREKAWSEFVSNNGLSYGAEQQLRVAFIGGWVRARASRPREAKCPACGGVGEHVEGKRGFTRFPCPNAAPIVAPEACPVAPRYVVGMVNGAWCVVDAEASEVVERFGTHEEAYAKMLWLRTAPPASATADGGGAKRSALPRLLEAVRVLSVKREEDVSALAICAYADLVSDAYSAYLRAAERDATTPASAAGREGAVEKVVEAAKAWATSRVDHDASNVALLVAVDALLAAEAEAEGGGARAANYVQQVPFKGCACAGCLADDPLHHPYLCETCYAKVVPAPKGGINGK